MNEDIEALAAACREAREVIAREQPHYEGLLERLDRALARFKPPPKLTWEHQGTRWTLLDDGQPTGIGILHEDGGYYISVPQGELDLPAFGTLDEAQEYAECGVGKV